MPTSRSPSNIDPWNVSLIIGFRVKLSSHNYIPQTAQNSMAKQWNSLESLKFSFSPVHLKFFNFLSHWSVKPTQECQISSTLPNFKLYNFLVYGNRQQPYSLTRNKSDGQILKQRHTVADQVEKIPLIATRDFLQVTYFVSKIFHWVDQTWDLCWVQKWHSSWAQSINIFIRLCWI